jgi:hypothetical protein
MFQAATGVVFDFLSYVKCPIRNIEIPILFDRRQKKRTQIRHVERIRNEILLSRLMDPKLLLSSQNGCITRKSEKIVEGAFCFPPIHQAGDVDMAEMGLGLSAKHIKTPRMKW